MAERTIPILLAPDALGQSVKAAVDRALADADLGGDKGGAQVSFTHVGAQAKVFVRVKNLESGAVVDRTWTGDISAAGYVRWRW